MAFDRKIPQGFVMIATDWEYDRDFITLLEQYLQNAEIPSWIVTPENLEQTIQLIRKTNPDVLALIDRASDTSPEFICLQSLLHEQGVRIFDPVEQIRWVSDKATLHLEFLTAGIPTPYTIILPPYEEKNTPALHVDDLAHLGRPFVIKPANTTGGGIGVVNGAESLQEILQVRTEFQSDKYLIQEKIIPMEKDGYRFWFRCFYVGGQIFTAWWHDKRHTYTVIKDELFEPYGLMLIPDLMQRIAHVAGLTFFSSEIVYCVDGRWVVVDYVNESCDMRLQSRHIDGVPDALVRAISDALAGYVIESMK